jgi:hypothetical protein
VRDGGQCHFYFSGDGVNFTLADAAFFTANVGRWVGAKVGVFAAGGSGAIADYDFCRVQPVAP